MLSAFRGESVVGVGPAADAAAPRHSLRRRVAAALVAIVGLFAAVQGLLAYLSLHEQEDEIADRVVLEQAQRLARLFERSAEQAMLDLAAPAPNTRAWLVDARGDARPRPLPAHLRSLSDGPHRASDGDAQWHIVVMPTSEGRLVVEYDARPSEAAVHAFGWYLLALGLLCVALAVVTARRLATVILAPIERVTALLDGWAPGAPAGPGAASAEEHRLLDAFRRVQARFEQSLADEREFLANVRHEIRTPLAALRTDLELAALKSADGAQRERLQRALQAVDAIAGSLEAARALSHRRAEPARPVPLAACVADAWESLGDGPSARGLQFRNLVPADAVVSADRHALLTILRNLMRNAAEHAAPATCTVRKLGPGGPVCIAVEDDGPGILPDDLPFVFERYYRGRLVDAPVDGQAGERGLGLAIARQMAELHGWRLSAEPVEPHGTRFVLHLAGV